MSTPILALFIASTVFAGCMGADPGPSTNQVNSYTTINAAPTELPEPIERTIRITAAFDVPLPEGEEEFCWMATQACTSEPFTVPADGTNITMTASLDWDKDANNLGLFLYRGDEAITYDSNAATTGTSRSLDYQFDEPGEYRLVVDAHWAAADTAELKATFAWT